jgi:uncharacterized membrane protein (UPF0127 family)
MSSLLLGLIMFTAGALGQTHIKVFMPDGTAITAELAVTPEARAKGLMYRDRINPDQGMLFLFEREGKHSFWMKNMRFAIDILWLDRDKRIIHIEQDIPPCASEDCPSYAPSLPAMYVLELAAGSVDRLGIKLFQRLDFVREPAVSCLDPGIETLKDPGGIF